MEQINEKIKSEIESISLVDTHEHIMLETDRNDYALDFSYLFSHYNSSDLVSAGMPPRLMEAARLPMHNFRLLFSKRMGRRQSIPEPERDDMSLEEKCLKTIWQKTRLSAWPGKY